MHDGQGEGCIEAVQVGCIEGAAGSIVAAEVGCSEGEVAEVGNTQGGYTDGCIEVEDGSCMSEVLYASLILLYDDWVLGLAVKDA